MHATLHLLDRTDFPVLRRARLSTLQVNLGYRCNLTILSEPKHEDRAAFLADQGVEGVPQGPSLPPPQNASEQDYTRELESPSGIRFGQHFALTNMPIQRFGSTLVSKGTFQSYMQSLKSAYLPENLDTVKCNSMVSVDWKGALYDCDFNPMLGLRAQLNSSPKPHLRDLLAHDAVDAPIRVAEHCHGCTSGQGSSCGGALDASHATSTAAASP